MIKYIFLLIIPSNLFSHCDIWFIRHGETVWNRQGRMQGHTDIPLNKKGEQQALILKEKFKDIRFSYVYSSDLSRACRTAELATGLSLNQIVPTPALRERCMGAWEGQPVKELKEFINQSGGIDSLSQEEYLAYKIADDVESHNDVYKRVEGLIKSIAQHPAEGPILCATHGGVMRVILYVLDFKQGMRWLVENGAYLRLRVDNNGGIIIVESHNIKSVVPQDAPIPF